MRRYVIPSLRNNQSIPENQDHDGLRPTEHAQTRTLQAYEAQDNASSAPRAIPASSSVPSDLDVLNDVSEGPIFVQRGGCADPKLVEGSIMDKSNIPSEASKLRKSRSEAHGSYGGQARKDSLRGASVKWEIGAVSECGTRESNEDAYLIVNNLMETFRYPMTDSSQSQTSTDSQNFTSEKIIGLFGLFDGHSGNQAARYAAENLTGCLKKAIQEGIGDFAKGGESILKPEVVESGLREALKKLDHDFCHICHEDGRNWYSGTTALVAIIVDTCLIVANLGDCRGVLCRTVLGSYCIPEDEDWNEFDIEEPSLADSAPSGDSGNARCIWKEVATPHKPSDEKEQERIELAHGWVTTETDRPSGQQRHLDFLNQDVIEILLRSFGDRYVRSGTTVRERTVAPQRIVQISRVCGELSVSRALGDRDFKAAFHSSADTADRSWHSPLQLSYPKEHLRVFRGDLVDNTPDIHQVQIAEDGCFDEFLLIASDGLWDVLDMNDAVRVTRDLLFQQRWTAKRTAARLAELAIHLGSSDNVTVVVVRIVVDAEIRNTS